MVLVEIEFDTFDAIPHREIFLGAERRRNVVQQAQEFPGLILAGFFHHGEEVRAGAQMMHRFSGGGCGECRHRSHGEIRVLRIRAVPDRVADNESVGPQRVLACVESLRGLIDAHCWRVRMHNAGVPQCAHVGNGSLEFVGLPILGQFAAVQAPDIWRGKRLQEVCGDARDAVGWRAACCADAPLRPAAAQLLHRTEKIVRVGKIDAADAVQ